MIELRKIDDNNLWDVIKLSVFDEQKTFVATNTESILEAYLAISSDDVALPFAIYNDETLVGFIMFGFSSMDEENGVEVGDKNYVLWRFMIDKEHQGKGYGKGAMKAALDFVRTKPCGEADCCWLSYEPENTVAKKLYESFGFVENGKMAFEEIIAELKL